MAINISLNLGIHIMKQRSYREEDRLLIQSYSFKPEFMGPACFRCATLLKPEFIHSWHVNDTYIVLSSYLIL